MLLMVRHGCADALRTLAHMRLLLRTDGAASAGRASPDCPHQPTETGTACGESCSCRTGLTLR